MIEVKNLVKSYGNYQAVKGVSFSAEKGEILGLLGPNGAGKTTLMRILTCFLPSTSGQAKVAGFDCEKHPEEVRRRVGYLPENNPLYPDMRVREFVDFCAQAKGIPSGSRPQAVATALAETGTDVVGGRLIRQLSKGFRQRVGLAQALVGDPEVLILDEPTVGLDPKQITEIRALIRSLAGKRTLILSTHILPEVSAVCSHVVIINKGLVVESDTTANLGKKLSKSNKVLVQVQGPKDAVLKQLKEMEKVRKASLKEELEEEVNSFVVETTKDSDLRSALAEMVVRKGWGLRELRFVGLELEEIFLQLVRDEGAIGAAGSEEEAAA